MKVRKLAVALALAGGLGSGVANALGLGEIELQSFLNEPLEAQINLPKSSGVNPDEVFVNIASEADYSRIGVSRNYFLTKLRFDVSPGRDGNLVVKVSSREPLKEPYLNFLLEVTWPSGRLMREYSVLIDPPVYAEESRVQEVVSPAAATVAATATPTDTSSSTVSETPNAALSPEPAVTEPAVAETAVTEPAVAESAVTEPAVTEPEPEPESVASAEPVEPAEPVDEAPAPAVTQTREVTAYGPTGSSDTLWQIASKVRPDESLTHQQVMLAIQDLNPGAFIDGNINRLKRGEILRIPTAEQIQSRTRAEAIRQVMVQNEAFAPNSRELDATLVPRPDIATAPAEGSGRPSPDELKLLVANNGASRNTEEGGSAGGDGQSGGSADAGSVVVMEELESARRANDELTGRVEDLQSQVETLQRLLELKNSQLAELQGMAGAADTPATGDDAQPVAGVDSVATETGDGVTPATGDTGEEGVAESAVTEQDAGGSDESSSPESTVESGDAGMTGTDGSESEPESGIGGQGDEPAPVAGVPVPSQSSPEPRPVPAQPPVVEKGFPGNVIDAITGNFLYQVALGGGLVLLLLVLLLVARRNANREKAFYDDLGDETAPEAQEVELSLDDDAVEGEVSDAIAEADVYVSYGRLDQAAQVLESGISREPSRTDLRLKLLGVYADAQDRDSFEKQYRELEAMDDDAAIAQAADLKSRLEEAESFPSIDDLESQLRTGSFGMEGSEAGLPGDESLADQFENEPTEGELAADFDFQTGEDDLSLEDDAFDVANVEAEEDTLDFELPELDLDSSSVESPSAEDSLSFDLETPVSESSEDNFGLEFEPTDSASEADDFGIDFNLSESDAGEPETDKEETGSSAGLELGDDFDSLNLEDVSLESLEAGDQSSPDESFLDELDAELERVASGANDDFGSGLEEGGLDELELDVSDEDLALMEEVSEGGNEIPMIDESLNLEDSLIAGDDEQDIPVAQSADIGDLAGGMRSDSSASMGFDESELGDDDDFDFLSGTDEAATKLDLARAYIEMGDSDGARDILEEVAIEGNDGQKAEAQELLKKLS